MNKLQKLTNTIILLAILICGLAILADRSAKQTSAAPPPTPGVGMVVNYILPDGPRAGHVVPAIIKRARENGDAKLVLFLSLEDEYLRAPADGGAIIRIIDAPHDEFRNLGTWHYVNRALPELD